MVFQQGVKLRLVTITLPANRHENILRLIELVFCQIG
jgi:hypothetical protein